MPRFSETEFKEWRDRLDFSHRWWKDNGLSKDSPLDKSAFRYIEAYRGNQWGDRGSWAGVRPEDLVTVNLVFSNTNQMMSRLSKRNPEPVVVPDGNQEERYRGARIFELILKYHLKELRMKREVDYALRDALLTPFGFVRHGYTPTIEKFNRDGEEIELLSKADTPWVRRVPFWDIRIDPLAANFHPQGGARWVAFRELIPKQHFRAHPVLIDRKDLRAGVTTERRKVEEKKRRRGGGDLGPDFENLVEVWWVYDKQERKRFAISPGSEKEVAEPSDWPLQWEDLPFDYLAFNEQADTNIGYAPPESYWSQQVELNKYRTLMSQIVKHMRRLILANSNALTDEDQDKIRRGDLDIFTTMLVEGDLENAVKEVGLANLGTDIILAAQSIKEDAREAIGLSNMDRGQRINVESATEAGLVQQGSDVQGGRNVETFETFWSDVLRHFAQSLQETLAEDTIVNIVGVADAAAIGEFGDFLTVSKEDIAGEYKYSIRAQSTLPRDRNQDLAKLLNLKQMFLEDPSVNVLELNKLIVETAGFDSSRLILTPQQTQATQQDLDARGVGAEGGNGAASPNDANLIRQLQAGGPTQ